MPEGKGAPKVLCLAADEREQRGREGSAKRNEKDKDCQQVRAANGTIGKRSGAITGDLVVCGLEGEEKERERESK